MVLDVVIGAVTFSGSLIASGKLMGLISGKPIIFPGSRILTVALAVVAVGGTALLILDAAGTVALDGTVSVLVLGVIVASALVFGVTMVLPIGGADMPVVISLLNAFTGTAVAMAGFVLNNPVLIVSGALVGASGGILTKLMADAMNRSILNIMIGGFGGGEGTVAGGAGGRRRVGPLDRGRRRRDPAGLRGATSSSSRATASPWPRPSTPSASWPSSSRRRASTSRTRSIRSPAGCRGT